MNRVEVSEPALLLRIPELYKEGMSDHSLYEATRGVWKVGKRREAVQYALAVADGIVRDVFVIGQWHPAGTTGYVTRESTAVHVEGRWEFTGSRASDGLREKYVGHSVAHYFARGASNPVRYVNA
jgi:hypothetical protein